MISLESILELVWTFTMWLESILEVVCVSTGCVVLWLWRGRRYDLPEELRHLRQLDLWRWQGGKGREALVGLVTLLIIGGLVWIYRRWY